MFSSITDEAIFEPELLSLSSQMDAFERYPDLHAHGMATLTDQLASAFNIAAHDRFLLHQTALIHDLGEMDMARDYIGASRALASGERIDLQRHPVIGEQSTSKLGMPRAVQLIIRWHHEWWNGGGYPDGLEGDQIPLAARILRVADTYSSLVSRRPFREACSEDEARKYMVEWAGIEFDPAVVKTFLAIKQS